MGLFLSSFRSKVLEAGLLGLLISIAGFAQATKPVQETDVRAEMEALAGDAARGRGSATEDELRAGEYIASQFKKFGIAPAGDKDSSGNAGYIQAVSLSRQEFAAPPIVSVGTKGQPGYWEGAHGKDLVVLRVGGAKISAPLQKLKDGEKIKPGAMVYVHVPAGRKLDRSTMSAPLEQGAAGVIMADDEQLRARYKRAANRIPQLPTSLGNTPASFPEQTIVVLNEAATKQFDQFADGATVQISGELKPASGSKTWNVLGVITGCDPKLSKQAILLTAHMDHLGVDPKLKGDQIYNGADDDASGVTAVLEMARALGAVPKPKRTIYFVLFGSEEKGGYGAQYFLQNSPLPLTDIAANLEFEMIGRPDASVETQTLWLTGYDRTNLGPELAKHGARLVADPHPDQNFFMRSDNYALARKGVVAQTISSFGLHKDYHQVSDAVSTIDFAHMTRAINSMVEPVLWLANSDFTPHWLEGKKP